MQIGSNGSCDVRQRIMRRMTKRFEFSRPTCKLLNYFFLRTLKVADYFRQENWYPPILNHGARIGIGSGQLTLHTQNENQEIQTPNKNEAHTFQRHKIRALTCEWLHARLAIWMMGKIEMRRITVFWPKSLCSETSEAISDSVVDID